MIKDAKADYTKLIELLKTRIVTHKEIMAYLRAQNPERKLQDGTVRSVVDCIGYEYPIYEPGQGKYKILTEEDLAQEERRIKKDGRNK